MAYFPLFIDLQNKRCVVVGGGAVAARKVETLLQFGAAVTVISEACGGRMRELAESGRISYRAGRYQAGDLQDAFLAIAATDDREINARIYEEATERGIWINVADEAAQCSFFFPAVVQRDSLVVGITSSGVFPALTKKIREMIEQILPTALQGKTAELYRIRAQAKHDAADPAERKAVLRRVAEKMLDAGPGLCGEDGPEAQAWGARPRPRGGGWWCGGGGRP